MTSASTRVVSSDLGFVVSEPIDLVLQIAVAATAGTVLSEAFDVRIDGESIDHVEEIEGPHGARLHALDSPRGHLTISYRAEIDTAPPEPSAGAVGVVPAREYAELVYLRPSRYCPTDHLVGFALAEFGTTDPACRVDSIMEWIWQRIEYLPGSGSVHDSAEDTLLTGMGTCRDFAHLGVAMCRALELPARFTAVYAPGLSPMDFHAVVEVCEDGTWRLEDPTRLAPRSAMVRIMSSVKQEG